MALHNIECIIDGVPKTICFNTDEKIMMINLLNREIEESQKIIKHFQDYIKEKQAFLAEIEKLA
jgi:hypothetical protein